MTVDIKNIAHEINIALQESFNNPNREEHQVLCLAEEIGEFVGAYRRYIGGARRDGPWSDVVEELADIVITSWVLADMLKIDLEQAMSDKLTIIFNRGWKEK